MTEKQRKLYVEVLEEIRCIEHLKEKAVDRLLDSLDDKELVELGKATISVLSRKIKKEKT